MIAFHKLLSKEGFYKKNWRKYFLALFIFIITPGWLSAQAKTYIISAKNQGAFEKLNREQKRIQSTGQTQWMGMSVQRLRSLKHLEMFIVELDENQSEMQLMKTKEHPDVLNIREDVIFQGLESNIAYQIQRTIPNFAQIKEDPDEPPSDTPDITLTWGQKAIHSQEAWAHSRGSGARVLVLDTGVDKDHPEFQGNFEKGKNLLSEDELEKDLPYPFFDDHSHGTHTAGTVLGQSMGVAPEAHLLSGKICNASGRCSMAAILAGLDWGIEEQVDVINLSIGGPQISDEEIQAFEKLEEAGVVAVASAGNNGSRQISYPGRVSTVLSVGAVNKELKKPFFSQYGPDLGLVGPGVNVLSSTPGKQLVSKIQENWDEDSQAFDSIVIDAPLGKSIIYSHLAFAKDGTEEDVAELDLRGKIALVERGTISFSEKAKNVADKGAIALIIYNSYPGLHKPLRDFELEVPAFLIRSEAGEQLVTQLESGESVSLLIQTHLTDSYGMKDGTSMSCPHVAGVAALVRALNKDLNQEEVREVLLSTATDLNDKMMFGAGMVNAEQAALEAIARRKENPEATPAHKQLVH